jgi:molecular chaperone Hsp33
VIGDNLDPETELTLDLIQPFQLERANVRGRAVRLNKVLADVLGRHDYPPQVEQVVAETITAALLLASLLKYDGIFTLQVKGDGPISLLVVDIVTGGDVRAYARFDAERLPAAGAAADVETLFGAGYLAFTVDQGEAEETYQAIVALTGATLTDCMDHYFAQSEQLLTTVKLAARQYPDGWRAGAILIQRLPDDDAGRILKSQVDDEEDWHRANVLLGTVAEVELLDRTLHLNSLLFRLFHEEQVRVFTPAAVKHGCRCSEARVAEVLRTIPASELEDLKVDNQLTVTCEFCGRVYKFDEVPA